MSNDIASLSSILELTPRTAADFCDLALTADALARNLDAGQPYTRKTLCAFLGIGESTLSGWLKEGRIPQMAKNAVVLLEAHQRLAAEIRRLNDDDLRVVRTGDHYQVCEMKVDDDGEIVGRVVADHIATIEDARLLVSGRRALRVIKSIEHSGVFDYVYDMSENEPFIAGVQAAHAQAEAHELFLTNYPQWQVKFGKRSVDSLPATANPAPEPTP